MITKREQIMRAIDNFHAALTVAQYSPSEKERMIAGARLLLTALGQTGIAGPATIYDANLYLRRETAKE